jgi:hypothetical protein
VVHSVRARVGLGNALGLLDRVEGNDLYPIFL